MEYIIFEIQLQTLSKEQTTYISNIHIYFDSLCNKL